MGVTDVISTPHSCPAYQTAHAWFDQQVSTLLGSGLWVGLGFRLEERHGVCFRAALSTNWHNLHGWNKVWLWTTYLTMDDLSIRDDLTNGNILAYQ